MLLNFDLFTPGVNWQRASRLPEKAKRFWAIQFRSLGDTVLPRLEAALAA